jgi:hypothetical protein
MILDRFCDAPYNTRTHASLTGDRHARPRSTVPVHAGSLIGSLKESWSVFARAAPINHGGAVRQTVFRRRVATLPFPRSIPPPVPRGGKRRRKGERARHRPPGRYVLLDRNSAVRPIPYAVPPDGCGTTADRRGGNRGPRLGQSWPQAPFFLAEPRRKAALSPMMFTRRREPRSFFSCQRGLGGDEQIIFPFNDVCGPLGLHSLPSVARLCF